MFLLLYYNLSDAPLCAIVTLNRRPSSRDWGLAFGSPVPAGLDHGLAPPGEPLPQSDCRQVLSSVFFFSNYSFSFYDWDQLPRLGGCPPSPFSGGLPPCLFNLLAYPQTVSQLDLSFCTLLQNYKNIPQFETSFKNFSFPFENPAASPSLDRNEPHKRNIPP